MAERSNATSKKNQDAARDVSTLQKRGRRRLVGAIALVLLAVIVLPMVFDPEPRPNAPLVSIRIPSEEGTKFTPKVAPRPAAPQPEAPAVQEKSAAPAVAPKSEPAQPAAAVPKVEGKPPAKAAEKPAAPKPVEKAAAAVPVPAGEQFMVQVGAFSSPDKVKEITDQLKQARLAHYLESVATAKGPVTRVRLGPYASKEAAEKARERAKALGLSTSNPVAK